MVGDAVKHVPGMKMVKGKQSLKKTVTNINSFTDAIQVADVYNLTAATTTHQTPSSTIPKARPLTTHRPRSFAPFNKEPRLELSSRVGRRQASKISLREKAYLYPGRATKSAATLRLESTVETSATEKGKESASAYQLKVRPQLRDYQLQIRKELEGKYASKLKDKQLHKINQYFSAALGKKCPNGFKLY